MSIKSNLIMRQQVTAQLATSAQHAARAQEHRRSNAPAPEPTLVEKLRAAAPAFDATSLEALVSTELARIGERGAEVLTLTGWYPATEWAVRQAIDLIPERYEFTAEATHETVATRMVNRRRDSLGRPTDESNE